MDMTHRTRGHSVAFGGHWDKLLWREGHKQVSLVEEEGSVSSYGTLEGKDQIEAEVVG